jgi:hypothetical protein
MKQSTHTQGFEQLETDKPNTDVFTSDLGDAIATLGFNEWRIMYHSSGIAVVLPKPHSFKITEMDTDSLNESQKMARNYFGTRQGNKEGLDYFKKNLPALLYSVAQTDQGIQHIFTAPTIAYKDEFITHDCRIGFFPRGFVGSSIADCAHALDARAKFNKIYQDTTRAVSQGVLPRTVEEYMTNHLGQLATLHAELVPYETINGSQSALWIYNDKIHDKHIQKQQQISDATQKVA